jgi:heme exporter protein A
VADDYQAFRGDIVWLSHRVGCKADLNLLENLRFESGLRATDESRLPAILDRLSLSRLTELPFRSLSAGQQRRVALARLLLAKARIWMMDEPFTNLDKAGHTLVVELISEHLSEGGGCIVASHQALEIDGSTRRVSLQ